MAAPGRRLSHVLDRLWTRTGGADLSTLPLALMSVWTLRRETKSSTEKSSLASPRQPSPALAIPRQPSPAFARLKSHSIANPHQPSPNVNDSAPRPLFLSAANVNDHRAATHQPLVAARKVLWTSKTLPGDHFSRYGHCQRPRCLLCSSSPTPHCLPGTTVPPEPCLCFR